MKSLLDILHTIFTKNNYPKANKLRKHPYVRNTANTNIFFTFLKA